jgi:hypothetical protein
MIDEQRKKSNSQTVEYSNGGFTQQQANSVVCALRSCTAQVTKGASVEEKPLAPCQENES